MSAYKHPALKQLADQQVRFVPPPRRLEQMKRAERLLAEISPQKQYPYQYVCYRITDYRPDAYPDLLIAGEDLQNDLGVMIAELSGSLPAVPVEEVREPVLTLEQMSEKLNVTTKRCDAPANSSPRSDLRAEAVLDYPVLRFGIRCLHRRALSSLGIGVD